MLSRLSEMTPLEQLLWAIVGLLAVVAVVVFASGLVPGAASRTPVVPTQQARGVPPAASPLATATASSTPTVTPTPLPNLEPIVIPTPPAGGVLLTFSPNPDRTGWVGSRELSPHWRDRNLQSGTFQGQTLLGILQFDLRSLAPGSKIAYAALELTGRNQKSSGTDGSWSIELIDAKATADWDDVSFDVINKVPSLATLGSAFKPQQLAIGLTNRLILPADQLKILEQQLGIGVLTLRLRGQAQTSDNFFAWDAGPGPNEPVLYLVTVPSSFFVITPSPTPENVFAAATRVAQQTIQAKRSGTPTPLPRSAATATPYANVGTVIVTNTPTPLNSSTALFRSAYATAVAATTGTFTPIPPNWITATPPPIFIPMASLTPTPTPTPTFSVPGTTELAKLPIPSELYNKILFLGGSRQSPQIWVSDPDGKNLGLVLDRAIYDRAAARDVISPGGDFLLYNAPDRDFPDTLQIWSLSIKNTRFPPLRLTTVKKGVAYAPSWSPNGDKIAYVSQESGHDEIWVLDLNTKRPLQLTSSKDEYFWNQFPSWSPDGKRIVFVSDRGHKGSITEPWIMNPDGTGVTKVGEFGMDLWSPIWVKWNQ